MVFDVRQKEAARPRTVRAGELCARRAVMRRRSRLERYAGVKTRIRPVA